MGISREEYWSGLPFPSPGDLQEDGSSKCSILAWEIPWTLELSRLQPMGSQKVGYDLATKQLLVLGEHPISGSFFPKFCFFNKISKRCIHVFRWLSKHDLEKNPQPRGSLISVSSPEKESRAN